MIATMTLINQQGLKKCSNLVASCTYSHSDLSSKMIEVCVYPSESQTELDWMNYPPE